MTSTSFFFFPDLQFFTLRQAQDTSAPYSSTLAALVFSSFFSTQRRIFTFFIRRARKQVCVSSLRTFRKSKQRRRFASEILDTHNNTTVCEQQQHREKMVKVSSGLQHTKKISELSKMNSDRENVDCFKWGSRDSPHSPAPPPALHNSLHYPASETPVAATMLLGTKKWNFCSPSPAAPFFLSSSFNSNSRPSTRRSHSAPRTQPKKNERRSRNWNNARVNEPPPSSQVASLRLSGAKPPPPQGGLPPNLLQTQQQQQQQREKKMKKKDAGGGAAAAAARSAAHWRKNRTRSGRVAKKTAPITRGLTKPPTTTTTRRMPRAPCNSTQMLMHLYNAATAATKRNRNKKKNKRGDYDKTGAVVDRGIRPFSSLRSPRLDGTPVRLGSASSIAHLLRGHVDTFGTLLRTVATTSSPEHDEGGDGLWAASPAPAAAAVTPPFSPVDDVDVGVDVNRIDTFGSNLDDRDHPRRRCDCDGGGDGDGDMQHDDELGRKGYASQLSNDVFSDHRRRGEGEQTPLRRSLSNFSNFSNATNSTWMGDGVDDEDEDDDEKREGASTPSFLTSPVPWTPASPAPHRR